MPADPKPLAAFQPGERVIVRAGELAGEAGTVSQDSGGRVYIDFDSGFAKYRAGVITRSMLECEPIA